jgi:hypothetical protein
MKFRSLQRDGCIKITINVQTWHWAALPRNSDWPWLLNESRFWERLNKGGLPLGQVREIIKKWIYNYNLDYPEATFAILSPIRYRHSMQKIYLRSVYFLVSIRVVLDFATRWMYEDNYRCTKIKLGINNLKQRPTMVV